MGFPSNARSVSQGDDGAHQPSQERSWYPKLHPCLQQIALLNHRRVDRFQIGDWPLGLVLENWSSCPQTGHPARREERTAEPVFKDPTISALETGHPIDTAP